MTIFYKSLVNRWNKFSILKQMANIGAEIGRAINWKNKNNLKTSQNAFYRALELLDLSIDDPKNKNSLKEILRTRELLVDYFVGNNIYHSTNHQWEKYFYYFNFAARQTI